MGISLINIRGTHCLPCCVALHLHEYANSRFMHCLPESARSTRINHRHYLSYFTILSVLYSRCIDCVPLLSVFNLVQLDSMLCSLAHTLVIFYRHAQQTRVYPFQTDPLLRSTVFHLSSFHDRVLCLLMSTSHTTRTGTPHFINDILFRRRYLDFHS